MEPAKPPEFAVTVTAAVEAAEPFWVREEGEIEQVVPDGAPIQVTETVLLNPPRGIKLSK
jgi:hypothetical protein